MRRQLAEEKFRPLKKMMQQTFSRLKGSVQAEALPDRQVVYEFMQQVKMMISYPGFGDAAYPEFLSASEALATACSQGDQHGVQAAVQALLTLQDQCHQGRATPRSKP